MSHELIITEKPSAAKRLAEALADSKVDMKKENGVNYYSVKRGNKVISIVPAVGHLYTVAEKKKSFKEEYIELLKKFEIDYDPLYILEDIQQK